MTDKNEMLIELLDEAIIAIQYLLKEHWDSMHSSMGEEQFKDYFEEEHATLTKLKQMRGEK